MLKHNFQLHNENTFQKPEVDLEDGKSKKEEQPIEQGKQQSKLDEKQELKHKEPPKPRLFELMIEHIIGYSEVSTLHGVGYIADRTRHFTER